MKQVVVIGQGYVGLPLAIAASRAGFQVVGVDTNRNLVEGLNKGVSHVEDVTGEEILDELKSGRYRASHDFSNIDSAEVIVICLPTPLNKRGTQPDLSILIGAMKKISKYLQENSMVILESTVQPGTTRSLLKIIETQNPSLDCSKIKLVFSPERIDPTNAQWKISNTPKLIAGIDSTSLEEALIFYGKFIANLQICESLEIAELAKLLENSFRLLNISFINEISKYCNQIGVDSLKVIEAAGTKPYGFMKFYPSIGIGGHCIPVDPIYLLESADNSGIDLTLLRKASQINQEMPNYYVQQSIKKIGDLRNKKILVLGVAYKPNVSDVRETPAEKLIQLLKIEGARVYWHDNLVKFWKNEKSVEISPDYDLAILATHHSEMEISKIQNVPLIKAN